MDARLYLFTGCFVSDLVLPPWEVGADKANWFAHEKDAKNLLRLSPASDDVVIFLQESPAALSTQMSVLDRG